MGDDTETLAEVLAAHQYVPNPKNLVGRCSGCNWQHWDSCEADHRDHVAATLAARIVQARAGEGALRERVEALADEFDRHSDRMYDEARKADRDAAIVLRSKSGTYAVNAERLRAALDAAGDSA